MVQLTRQIDFKSARKLPFCYLCGKEFVPGDVTDGDHVPPQSIFAPEDREPLILATHKACNLSQHLLDEKIGELIRLKHPPSVTRKQKPQRLRVAFSPDMTKGAVVNVQVDEAVWRWVSGFHAAR